MAKTPTYEGKTDPPTGMSESKTSSKSHSESKPGAGERPGEGRDPQNALGQQTHVAPVAEQGYQGRVPPSADQNVIEAEARRREAEMKPEEEKGKDKIQRLFDTLPPNTPDTYILFGYGGISVTLGDVKEATGLKPKSPEK